MFNFPPPASSVCHVPVPSAYGGWCHWQTVSIFCSSSFFPTFPPVFLSTLLNFRSFVMIVSQNAFLCLFTFLTWVRRHLDVLVCSHCDTALHGLPILSAICPLLLLLQAPLRTTQHREVAVSAAPLRAQGNAARRQANQPLQPSSWCSWFSLF